MLLLSFGSHYVILIFLIINISIWIITLSFDWKPCLSTISLIQLLSVITGSLDICTPLIHAIRETAFKVKLLVLILDAQLLIKTVKVHRHMLVSRWVRIAVVLSSSVAVVNETLLAWASSHWWRSAWVVCGKTRWIMVFIIIAAGRVTRTPLVRKRLELLHFRVVFILIEVVIIPLPWLILSEWLGSRRRIPCLLYLLMTVWGVSWNLLMIHVSSYLDRLGCHCIIGLILIEDMVLIVEFMHLLLILMEVWRQWLHGISSNWLWCCSSWSSLRNLVLDINRCNLDRVLMIAWICHILHFCWQTNSHLWHKFSLASACWMSTYMSALERVISLIGLDLEASLLRDVG